MDINMKYGDSNVVFDASIYDDESMKGVA